MTYYLKYKDINLLRFNTVSKQVELLTKNISLLPYNIANMSLSYSMIRKFCSDRILMMNREYCKEILTSCGIDDQSDINICIVGKALSFRDNYWICKEDSKETWGMVNLYNNKFSTDIQYVSLTGDTSRLGSCKIDDNLYTGELTNKGTRAKCFYRQGSNLYLIKNEKLDEISSEIITFHIARGLGLSCSEYIYKKINGLDCSICQILTSENFSLIPCRDIMSYYGDTKTFVDSNTYKLFMSICRQDFIKMQLLDYIVLNTDRNRDNYGFVSKEDGKLFGLYPIFDHDSCFKGKLENAIYFPSGMSFANTLDYIKCNYGDDMNSLTCCLNLFKSYICSDSFKELFLKYKSLDEYNAVVRRTNNILR